MDHLCGHALHKQKRGVLNAVGSTTIPCGEDVKDGVLDQISENPSNRMKLSSLSGRIFFYQNQTPQHLPTYFDDEVVCPHGGVTDLIIAATIVLIIIGNVIESVCQAFGSAATAFELE